MPRPGFLYLKSSLPFIFFIVTVNLFSFNFSPVSENFFKAVKLGSPLNSESEEQKLKLSLLRQVSFSGAEPVRSEARIMLLKAMLDMGDYTSTIALGKIFLSRGIENGKDIALLTAEAIYKEQDPRALDSFVSESKYLDAADTLTFRLLASSLKGVPPDITVLDRFLTAVPLVITIAPKDSPGRFSRVYSVFKKVGILDSVPEREKNIFLFKVSMETGKFTDAAVYGQKILDLAGSLSEKESFLTPALTNEIVKASAKSGKISKILESFNGLARRPLADMETRAHIYWARGYLYGRMGLRDRGMKVYREGLAFLDELHRGKDIHIRAFYDKLLWYWYSSVVHSSPQKAMTLLDFVTSRWGEPEYFDDILSDLATMLMRKGMWEDVKTLLEKLEDNGGYDILSRLAYVTARSAQEGYITGNEPRIKEWFELSMNKARGVGSGLYYKILSRYALGRMNVSSEKLEKSGSRKSPDLFGKANTRELPFLLESPNDSDNSKGRYDELLYGAAVFDLPDYGKSVFETRMEYLSAESVRFFTEYLGKRGDYIDSIRLMNRFAVFRNYMVSDEDIDILYPPAYFGEILNISSKENLPVPVFMALIREESHFSPEIVSPAGAVGLSQLMPSTAKDVAERMGYKAVELKNPTQNLALGGWYLHNLISRTDTMAQALFAYNGGLTRVRRWKKEHDKLPEDLFLEVLPYKETSLYGRKVLVSAVVYGYLYSNMSSDSIIKIFFKGF